jgi:hypothetical protein
MKINKTIIDSIPIRKDCKKYFTSKYEHLVRHNGLKVAQSTFKKLASYMKSLRSGYDAQPCPVRRTGWVKHLEETMLTQPHYVLNFLKLYSVKGEMDVDTCSREYHESVKAVDVDTSVPLEIRAFIKLVWESHSVTRRTFYNRKADPKYVFHAYFSAHSLNEILAYKRKWRRVLSGDNEFAQEQWFRPITPEVYKDHIKIAEDSVVYNNILDHSFNTMISKCFSDTFNQDVEGLPYYLDNCPYLDGETREYMYSILPHYFKDESLCEILNNNGMHPADNYNAHTDILGTAFAGDIHFIPKHGSDYRAIAVPNRFLQSGMEPGYDFLRSITKKLPKDCTYDQGRFDQRIQNRVNNDSLYVYGIDLSKATDNLPLSWFEYILAPTLERSSATHLDDIKKSIRLFTQVSRSSFRNEGFPTQWDVGQPLGTLPSFQALAITHNILCEAISLACGQGHSPYAVLGDDLLVFNKKLGARYTKLLKAHRIPISLQKSYRGKLVDFAGKTFVKNALPFYTPAHNVITYESLFDYQKASGVTIPWSNIPKSIRRRFMKSVEVTATKMSGREDIKNIFPSGTPGEKIYCHCQKATIVDRGTNADMHTHKREFYEAWGYALAETQDSTCDVGITTPALTSNAHLFRGRVHCLVTKRHDFHFTYTEKQLPEWYRTKFRPVTTDLLAAQGYIIQTQLQSSMSKLE